MKNFAKFAKFLCSEFLKVIVLVIDTFLNIAVLKKLSAESDYAKVKENADGALFQLLDRAHKHSKHVDWC